MSTIVDQLRDRAYATKAGDPLSEEAAALIEGLEWRSKVHANVIARLSAEVERLRLTDEEREAIGNMIHLIECQHEDYGREAATLRKLLEKTK
jgi:hypothetical protein